MEEPLSKAVVFQQGAMFLLSLWLFFASLQFSAVQRRDKKWFGVAISTFASAFLASVITGMVISFIRNPALIGVAS